MQILQENKMYIVYQDILTGNLIIQNNIFYVSLCFRNILNAYITN